VVRWLRRRRGRRIGRDTRPPPRPPAHRQSRHRNAAEPHPSRVVATARCADPSPRPSVGSGRAARPVGSSPRVVRYTPPVCRTPHGPDGGQLLPSPV
jgi:hypothetical protein